MKHLIVIYSPYKLDKEKKARKKLKKQFKKQDCEFLIIENDDSRKKIEVEIFFNPYQL